MVLRRTTGLLVVTGAAIATQVPSGPTLATEPISHQSSVVDRGANRPDPVRGVTAKPTSDTVRLRWKKTHDEDVAKVVVRRAEGVRPAGFRKGVRVGVVKHGRRIVARGLLGATPYTFSIFAVSSDGRVSRRAVARSRTLPDSAAPATVAGLVAERSGGGVQLTWRNPSDPDLAQVLVRRANGAAPATAAQGVDVPLATSLASSTSDSGVDLASPSGTFYSVFTKDRSGNLSGPVSAVLRPTAVPAVDTNPPSDVGNITSVPEQRAVLLRWTPPEDDDVARIVVTRRGPAGEQSQTFERGITSFRDTGLAPDSDYLYTWHTIDAAGNASSGTSLSVTTLVDDTGPQVDGLTSTSTDAAVVLTWNPATDVDLDHYEVRRLESSTPPAQGAGALISVTTEARAVDGGLRPGAHYSYALWAVDSLGNYGPRATVTTATQSAPAGVSDITATTTRDSVTLSWTNPDSSAAIGYLVRGAVGRTVPSFANAEIKASLDHPERTVTIGGLSADQTYTFGVWTMNSALNTSDPVAIFVKTKPDTRPAPVSALSVEPNKSGNKLAWTASPDSDVVSYVVRRRSGATAPTNPTDGEAVATLPATERSLVDRDLEPGTEYAYSVFAKDADGEVSTGASVTASPDLAAPGTVTDAAIYASGMLEIRWKNPTDADLYSVVVRRMVDNKPTPDTGSHVGVALAPEHSVVDVDVPTATPGGPPHAIFYGIWAVDRYGNIGAPTYLWMPMP